MGDDYNSPETESYTETVRARVSPYQHLSLVGRRVTVGRSVMLAVTSQAVQRSWRVRTHVKYRS